ncbi:MAG: tetratricopeptide repeat protein [Bacteroidia bacterium]|nr:tetratricopeptide repeat protein [Bacteroidia bacterium]
MKKGMFLFFLFPVFLFAQDQTIDSLKLALKSAKHDTARCTILSALAETAPDGEWEKYNEQLKTLAEKNCSTAASKNLKSIYLNHLASALNNSGFICMDRGEISKALEFYIQSLKLEEETGDLVGTAYAYQNIGSVYNSQGNIREALEFYSKSLSIEEKLGDKFGIASSLNNIGFIYAHQGDTAKALEYYTRSLKLKREIGDQNGIAITLNNLGVIYDNRGNIKKALEYYMQALEIEKELGNKRGIGNALNNIGFIYFNQNDAAKGLEYYFKSLEIRKELGDKEGQAQSLNNIGSTYMRKKELNKALEYCLQSLKISKEIGFPEAIRNASNNLAIIYKYSKNNKLALEMFELYITMRDSISNSETKKAGLKTQLKYEYEKRSAADSVKNAEQQKVKDAQLTAQTASLKQEKFQRYSLAGGLLIVLGGLGFVINRFRVTNKQKKIIEEQKIIVDQAFEKLHEKNKEVMDSIHYAKKIQRALITSEFYIEKKLKSFKKIN